jgi:tetratricopeptide (TPR) repeat protein
MDNFDTKLLSNRSLCLLRMGDGRRAYEDAADCTKLRPKWAKAHYRAGAALMFMKVHAVGGLKLTISLLLSHVSRHLIPPCSCVAQEYDAAYSSLSRALELDPESEEIEKLFW